MAHKSCLEPPFSRDVALHNSKIILPHAADHGDKLLDPNDNVRLYLQWDLQTPRIGSIQQYLWLAGLPRLARTLHRLSRLLRDIYVTEDPNEHLVWQEQCMSIKPLPEYLLNYDFWVQHIIHDEELCRSARGLLLSYAWLVGYRSDLRIASDLGLIPSSIDYEQWSIFRSETLQNIDQTILHQVSPRWRYGTLSLPRLKTLSCFNMSGLSIPKLTHKYVAYGSMQNYALFVRIIASILVILVDLTMAPLSLQVALGVERLGIDVRFQSLSYGIGLPSLAFVLLSVLSVFLTWWTRFRAHPLSTMQHFEGMDTQRQEESASANFPFESPMHVCSRYQDGWH